MPQILIDSVPGERRLALMESAALIELMLARETQPMYRDAVYRARVTQVVPAYGGAFLDLGHMEAFLDVRGQPPAEGSFVTVQITADPHGDKEARVSTDIRLPGRFAVLRPSRSDIVVSRKIDAHRTREHLHRLAEAEAAGGLILRTRAAAAENAWLRTEIAHLSKSWQTAMRHGDGMTAPGRLMDAPSALERMAVDWLSPGDKISVDSPALLKEAANTIARWAPDITQRPRLDPDPALFAEAGVETEIAAALDPTVPLAAGGRMRIEETAAFVAIDVDSGAARSWARDTTEERINLAAARHIPAEMRRRQLGGTVVVDFIGADAGFPEALAALRQTLETDTLAARPVGLGGMGLAAFSRRRLGPSLAEQMTHRHDTPTLATQGAALMRRIKTAGGHAPLKVRAHPRIADWLREHGLDAALTADLGRRIEFLSDEALAPKAEDAIIETP